MPELVVPDTASGSSLLDDERLTRTREMVGRQVFAFDGPLEEVLVLAEQLSAEIQGPPVLVNDVTDQTEETRAVDVYMHQNGRRMGVSEGVEKPKTN